MKKRNIVVFSMTVAMLLVGYAEGLNEKPLPKQSLFLGGDCCIRIQNPTSLMCKSLGKLLKDSGCPFGVELHKSDISSKDLNYLFENGDMLVDFSIMLCTYALAWKDINLEKIQNLRRLRILNESISVEDLNTLLNNNHGLREIFLVNLRHVDALKDGLLKDFTDIEDLRFQDIGLLTENWGKLFENNRKLRYLNYMCSLDGCGVPWSEMISKKVESLEELNVKTDDDNSKSKITAVMLDAILKNNKNLKSVYLNCKHDISKKELSDIAEKYKCEIKIAYVNY